jgi:DNA replication protein DnaC
MTNEEIIKGLKALKLTYLAENLTDFCREHGGPRANVRATLSDLVKKELDGSRQRSLERRLVNSKLDVKKLKFMADFDWSWPEGIDRGLVDSLLGLGFMKEPANVILAGTEGLGKSMIAKNIGYSAVMNGYNVLCVETAAMITDLTNLDSPRLLNSRLKRYTAPDLLILDEFGYLSYEMRAADILFEIINRRYEKGSIVITTNMPFTEWPKIFPGAACVRAMIDRLIHRSYIQNLSGDSYRLKEARETEQRRTKRRKTQTRPRSSDSSEAATRGKKEK